MALRLDDKKAMVAEVAAVAANAQSVVAAEYRGLTVTQMTDLRAKARKSNVYLRVVKNTLARKAIAGTPFECVGKSLKGPLILAFSKDDPGAAARLVKAFAKDNDKLKPTVVSLGGSALTAKDLDKVASLPTKQQAPQPAGWLATGADLEVRAHGGGTPREAGADHRCCERQESCSVRLKPDPQLETDSERHISE
jgi:large subunit ribosomal protein L10